MNKFNSAPKSPTAPKEKLNDPYSKIMLTRVNTSFYLGTMADRCAKLGIYQDRDPVSYRNAIEQLEIYAIGSDLLNKDYYDELKELVEKRNKGLEKNSVGYNPKMKKSNLNNSISKKISQIYLDFDKAKHKLLMKYLASSFWEKTREDFT